MRRRRRLWVRRPIVPVTTVEQLFSALRDYSLLSAEEVCSLVMVHAGQSMDLQHCVDELLASGMLTTYQTELLLEGHGASLVLGPYRILDWLGAGGMGQVYKAEHVLMKRTVALKVMASAPSEDDRPTRLQHQQITFPSPFLVPRHAFLREVQAAARLFHPHIVTAFDAAEIEGMLVLVMEYVEGVDLERLVEIHGPLPTPLACDYICQAASGLQHAHECGLVHGDIKPSNLLAAGSEGEGAAVIKILDMGLARLAGRPARDPMVVNREGREQAGTRTGLAGTPDYMAPELAHDSQCVSAQSDLYSLGCTFYYLLTGHVPFPADAWTEKLLRHQFDAVPLVSRHRFDVPPGIDAVLQKLLAKNPAHRHTKARQLLADLQEWRASAGDSKPLSPSLESQGAISTPQELTLSPEPPEEREPRVEQCADDSALCPHSTHGVTVTPDPALEWEITDSAPTMQGLAGDPPRASVHAPLSEASLPDMDLEVEPVPPALPDEPSIEQLRAALQPSPRRGQGMRMLGAMLLAAGVGGAAALLFHWNVTARPPVLDSSPSSTATQVDAAVAQSSRALFEVQSTSARHMTLTEAVSAARDGDVIQIHGEGPFPCAPVICSGKSLTLHAAPGTRPRLRCGASPALLTTDRPLVVEGIDLEWLRDPESGDGCTHLIYSNGSSLHLRNCRLTAAHGMALVVVRGGVQVGVRDCTIDAGALALCVEPADERTCHIDLRGNHIRIAGEDGAAISIWSAETHRPERVQLHLESNTVQADRVAAFRALPRGVEVKARGNHLAFRRALLSFVSFAGTDGWRGGTTWQGEDNIYHTTARWLQVDGVLSNVRRLSEWETLWGGAESGSIEKPLAAPRPLIAAGGE